LPEQKDSKPHCHNIARIVSSFFEIIRDRDRGRDLSRDRVREEKKDKNPQVLMVN